MYSRDLEKFSKEEIIEMCSKDVVNIRSIPRRNDDKRLLGPPIIELEFEKDILNPNIIIGGESIQLRMKKEKLTLCERCLQFGHPKKFCRSNKKFYRTPTIRKSTQMWGDLLPLLQRTTQDRR